MNSQQGRAGVGGGPTGFVGNANNNNTSGGSFQNFSLQPQQLQQRSLSGQGLAPFGLNQSEMSIPLPSNKEELQRLYFRWQTMKNQLGDAAPSNSEFIEISKVLRTFSKQQELYRQKLQQQQQTQGNPQNVSMGIQQQQQQQQQQRNFSPNGNVVPSSSAAGSSIPAPARNTSPQFLAPTNSASPTSAVGSGGAGSSPLGSALGNSPFTADQLNMLRNQMIAFKALSKNLPMPPSVQAVLFNRTAPPQQAGASPQSRQPPQQQSAMATPSPESQKMLQQQQQVAPSPGNHSNKNSPSRNIESPGSSLSSKRLSAQAVSEVPVAQKLGVTGYVDPTVKYLPESVSFEGYLEATDPSRPVSDAIVPYVPSLMPIGLDVQAMKMERERYIRKSIDSRIAQLSSKGARLSIKEKIEFKSLQMLDFGKALKGDLLTSVFYFNSIGLDDSNRLMYSRIKKLSIQEANTTEQFSNLQRIERQRRENQKKLDYLNVLCRHANETQTACRGRKSRQNKLGKAVVQYHSFIEKEEQRRLERTAKQRLQALKANDEEAYIKLLDQTKDTRITHLLKQTNTFLDSLAQAVKSQQAEARGLQSTSDLAAGGDEEPDEDGEKIDYYAVAHKVREDVYKQPTILVGGQLKEYQIKGLQWMVSLYNNNLNGILADEMGLGKTIQSISLITYLIEVKKVRGPYLVIVPLSTLTNWNMEFEKWAPSVKKVVYKGPPLQRKTQQATIRSGDFQVLLTTYEYIIKDRSILSRIKWVHMIIDEGHRMKNAQSKLSYTLTQYYSSRYRLILTGTPLQNNLPELWALLNFVLPKIFNSVKSFDEWFNTPFASAGGQDRMDLSEEETLLIIRRLHKVLRPFLLRRLKKDVEKDLPDKVEKVIKCKMSALQMKLYQQMLKHRVIFLGENAHGASSSGLKGLNNQIMQLRKICNHPYVFEEVESLVNPNKQTGDDLWRTAGKFELLDRVLPKFKLTGHRVLIFFQMTQIMDIMEDFLRMRGMQYLRLDGGTKSEDRSELLKLFNAPDSPYFAFLLSTRAGGLGLNLQTADTVIIYDTDWNPHQDLQAQDRAHRIGQTREVRILRLITENSIEENILERAHQKLDIDSKVIQAGKFDNKSTSEEQEAFLRSLLEAEEAGVKEDDDDELDDEELNEILARSDQERVQFKAFDRERIANDIYSRSRLMTDEELPEVYKQDIVAHLQEEDNSENYGRGARERHVLHYDDGLTEEQWLEAVDNDEDTLEEAIARKRARITKRKVNRLKKDVDSPESTESPGTPGTPRTLKRKRADTMANRKIRADTGNDDESGATPISTSATPVGVGVMSLDATNPIPPRKKAKGRPPKVKETLSIAERLELTTTMQHLYNHVMQVQDEETGRGRIDLFLELPSKRMYPDYYMLIKFPIACDLILKRINNNTYQRLGEFMADFKLMFDNARTYNEEGSFVYDDANKLEAAMNERLANLVPGASVATREPPHSPEDGKPAESSSQTAIDDVDSSLGVAVSDETSMNLAESHQHLSLARDNDHSSDHTPPPQDDENLNIDFDKEFTDLAFDSPMLDASAMNDDNNGTI